MKDQLFYKCSMRNKDKIQ